MKFARVFYIALLLLILQTGVAQSKFFGSPNQSGYDEQKFHFGFLIAYNMFNFTIKSDPDFSKYDSLMIVNTNHVSGFGLGLIGNMRLGRYFDLRLIPSFAFGGRRIVYTFTLQNQRQIQTKKGIESVYLDIPLLVKFKSSKIENFRFFVVAGGQFSMDLISNKKRQESNPKEIYLNLNRYDIQGQAGVGLDIYFNYFKLTTEFKMSFGFFDLLQHESNLYAQSVKSLKSKIMQLSFIFE